MIIIVSKFLFVSDLNFTGRPNLNSLTNCIHAGAKCLWKAIKCKYKVWKNNSQEKSEFPPLWNFYFEFVMIFWPIGNCFII